MFSTDLDGDGDKDVLASSYFDNKLVWFENLDGVAVDFENTQQVISTSLNSLFNPFVIDINQDNNLDLISISNFGNRIFLV